MYTTLTIITTCNSVIFSVCCMIQLDDTLLLLCMYLMYDMILTVCTLFSFALSSRHKATFDSAQDAEEFFVGAIEQWRQEMQLDSIVLAGHRCVLYHVWCINRCITSRI